jgi:cyclic beta-1,2-glucan synthetase
VSSVDSGNLAACLLAVKQACGQLAAAPIVADVRWDGLLDTVDVLRDVIARRGPPGAAGFAALQASLEAMRAEVVALRMEPRAWALGIAALLERSGAELDRGLLAAVATDGEALDPDVLSELRVWSAEVVQHLEEMSRDVELCLPWKALAFRPPVIAVGVVGDALAETWGSIERRAEGSVRLDEVPSICESVETDLSRLDKQLDGVPADLLGLDDARAWVARLQKASAHARENATHMLATLTALAADAAAIVDTMDFGFLYDETRRLFYIGHDASADRRDAHHYDLLASEARLASLVAIAKGDVPEEHWLALGRPLARVDGDTTLLSWSGTMFEYLMPTLLLREAADSLIGRAAAAAVQAQIAYATRRGLPWGVSESAYYRFDAHRNYQYRAFGVPDLGFKRGLEHDAVVSPYASVLALPFALPAVMANLDRLDDLGLVGRYGLYEAIDFTPARLEPPARAAIVRSFMAHHQGMILVAIDNALHGDVMVRRFHAEPIVRTAEMLLFERAATAARGQRARPEPEAAYAARPRPAHLEPWSARPHVDIPQALVLSNGRYRVLVSDGGDRSAWGPVALTRAEADASLDSAGFRLYLRDLDRRRSWSVAPGDGEREFHAHMVERRYRAHDITLHEQVCVAPDDDVEIRLVTLENHTASRRRLLVTSYAEVVVGDAAEDQRHPAFSKLFVESEYDDEIGALLFHRRRRSPREPAAWLAHLAVVPASHAHQAGHECSRERFLGRGRTRQSPRALDTGEPAAATSTRATLDPVMAVSAEIELAGFSATTFAYLVVAAESRDGVVALARRYRSLATLEGTLELARRRSHAEAVALALEAPDLPVAATLLALLVYPHAALRAPAADLARTRRGQRSLWKHAISGDLPILLVRIGAPEEAAVLPAVLRAYRFCRGRGVSADLVILNDSAEGYLPETTEPIDRAIAEAGADAWRDRPGGVFVVLATRLDEADRDVLLSAARVVLDGARGTLAQQVASIPAEPARLPRLVPSSEPSPPPERVPRHHALLFDNGLGGFSADGREYVIHLDAGDVTPAPWVNVIANPRFGFVVSETGGGYTWAENSGENRLTPWRNDPVSDEPGEVLYLRDEETTAVWTPTPSPAPAAGAHEIRYGAGYAVFQHESHGLDQSVRMWVPPADPVKIIELTLANRSDRPRRVTATYFLEWVIGVSRERSQAFVVPEFDPASETLLARNPWNEDFGDRVAFVAASETLHGLTADRTEFLGRHGSYAAPAAMARIGLASTVRAGLDPCAALQVHVDLAPRATARVHFLLGEATGRAEALRLAAKYRERAVLDAAWAELGRHWDSLLGAVTVRTPDRALDLMLNRWLLYQVVSSRFWGRTGYYQSSGAFGFRDQLQDVAALVHAAPTLCRAHILEAARHQFDAGDVLHWWHPPGGAGVRTRCSDDLLWLPFVTARYIEATGDLSILTERVPFLAGEPLRSQEAERYARFEPGTSDATLYEHCVAAIDRAHSAGAHGLPLFGSGDWNDGMNRVGIAGRGESVWLGWFLSATLDRFAKVSERVGDADRATALRRRAAEFAAAVDASAWDGAWYRRGYFDDGTPLGSAASVECRIDSLAQSWAVLSCAANRERAARAMDAVRQHLVRPDDGLILLLDPPFAGGGRDPGYIAAYPPGIRENGGQYTHAAMWALRALVELGAVDEAVDLFQRLLPINHALDRDGVARYRTEPYVLASDVYAAPPWTGRGGWTWYTGAAGWAYRLGIEAILGLRRCDGVWSVDPHIPATWPGFELVVRDGATVLHVVVENPRGVTRGIAQALFDGRPFDPPRLPCVRDGRTHEVRLTLG